MYSATNLRAVAFLIINGFVVAACSSSDADNEQSDKEAASELQIGDQKGTTCAAGFVGDPNAPPVIELRTVKADGSDVPLRDGDDLALILPPQGGRVAFVGIRVQNMDACSVELVGVLRDPTSKQLRLDGRTINLTRASDGTGVAEWATTGDGANIADPASIASYANIPICPNQWAETDIFDKPFELEITVTDRRRVKASASIKVTPKCAEAGVNEAECRCICRKGYVLGQKC